MPFCSPQCQLVDLNRWMNHEIGLPHIPNEDEEMHVPDEAQREWRFDDDSDGSAYQDEE